jgi:hypothetical protein
MVVIMAAVIYCTYLYFPGILRPTHLISCNASMLDLYSWTVLIIFFKTPVLYNKSAFQVPFRGYLFWLSRLLIPSGLRLLGFLDKSCVTRWGSEPYAQTQTGGSGLRVYVPPETGWSSYTPVHWVSILDTSYDTHGLRWGYSCTTPPHGNYLLQHLLIILQHFNIIPAQI